jgi:hypothetical protein
MTELQSDIHVVRDNDGSIQATINGEAADPNDPRVQEALALIDEASSTPGVHTTHVAIASGVHGTQVAATRDGQTIDSHDPSVQETITEMQQLAREAAATKKKRRFSFKFGSYF